jgi:hypothetical protein
MAKLTLSDLASLANQTAAISVINANNALIETALENTLSRDGTSPNEMESDFDMNSNHILNLPEPIEDTEPLRVIDAQPYVDAAEAAQTAAELALDQFTDIWLGNKASDPTTDNDGDSLDQGALYWNTTDQDLRVYDSITGQWYSVTSEDDIFTAANTSFTPAGTIAAVNVQAAIEEVASEAATNLTTHLNDTSDAHDASAISFSATGAISSTDVQAAIAELDTEKQPLDADLTALAALSTTGLVARTASNTYVPRTLTGTTNEVEITNGDGVSGNPTIGLPNDVTLGGSLTAVGATLSGSLSITGNDPVITMTDTDTSAINRISSNNASGSLRLYADLGNTVANSRIFLNVDNADQVELSSTAAAFAVDVTVPDEAYNATNWNASLEVPTKNAVRDQFETLPSTYQPLDSDLTSWAGVTRASGFDTFAATPTSANLDALVTDDTGSGALVFATSPTLVTPDLGTPSALVLTNATGLVTAGIVDDAVTYAKIQNVSAQQRFLGRLSSGAGNIEELTPGQTLAMLNSATGIYHPYSYGAIGDGSTDDTTAVQACFDAAKAAGGMVWLPDATFRVTSTIFWDNSATVGTTARMNIQGCGAANSIIFGDGIAGPTLRYLGGDFSAGTTQVGYVNIKGVQILGDGTGGSIGLRMHNAAFSHLQDVLCAGHVLGAEFRDCDQMQLDTCNFRENQEGIDFLAGTITGNNSIIFNNCNISNNSVRGLEGTNMLACTFNGGSIQYNGTPVPTADAATPGTNVTNTNMWGAKFLHTDDLGYGTINFIGTIIEGNSYAGLWFVDDVGVDTNLRYNLVGCSFYRTVLVDGADYYHWYGTSQLKVDGTASNVALDYQGTTFFESANYVPNAGRPYVAQTNGNAKIYDRGSNFYKNATESPSWAGTHADILGGGYQTVAGSATNPAYGFGLDTNTGIYNVAADAIGITCGGNLEHRFGANAYDLDNTTDATLSRSGAGRLAVEGSPLIMESDFNAWTTYTPTITASSGTPTTVSGAGAYRIIGKTMFITVKIVVTTVGTAAALMRVPLPSGTAVRDQTCYAIEYQATNNSGNGLITAGSGTINLVKYDGTTFWASGRTITMNATIELT